MNYEIIEMEEKTGIGIATVTNNASPDMGAKMDSSGRSFIRELLRK